MHSQLIRFKRGQLLLVPLLATLLAACGAPQATNDTPQATAPAATAGPTAAPAPTSASQASVEPTAAPAPTSAPAPTEAPTGAPVAGVLPAPLYMFDSQQQIVRLEANGTTLAPVTREPAPIMQYDISQADGALLYVVGLQPQQKLVRVDARGTTITVTDSGPGYPQELLADGPRRFATFTRGKGSGLGLTIAAKHAQVMGTHLRLSNRAAGGACARVELPASEPGSGEEAGATPNRG